jgi:hypothetical protein
MYMSEKKITQMSDEELIELARQLHGAIHSDCYGVDDLVLYYAVIDELTRRGYTVRTAETLVIEKTEEEDLFSEDYQY